MTTRYTGLIECPYCKKKTEFMYADEWGELQWCDNCEKKYRIVLKFIAKKIKRRSK